MKLWKNAIPILLTSVPIPVWVQQIFLKAAGQQRMGPWCVKMLPVSLFFLKFSCFLLTKCFLDCWKPFVNCQSSEKVDFDIFLPDFSLLLWTGKLSEILNLLTLPYFFALCIKNQSTLGQLYLTNKLYCSTFIFPFETLLLLFLILIFYCYSITVVCLFSPSLPPTPATPPSLPHLHPPPWFCPCVFYSSSCNPLSSLSRLCFFWYHLSLLCP